MLVDIVLKNTQTIDFTYRPFHFPKQHQTQNLKQSARAVIVVAAITLGRHSLPHAVKLQR